MSNELKGAGTIHTLPELLAHALAMETGAAERYSELADQMETHRKAAVAKIFRRLEQAEKARLGELTEMCSKFELPHIAPWDFKWSHSESPEAIDFTKVHYQLSVRGAILLAFEHERKAAEFYAGIALTTTDTEVQKLAHQFAEEEQQHLDWLETWLTECGPGDAQASDDPDPPLCQE
jgi:rubrerythrin